MEKKWTMPEYIRKAFDRYKYVLLVCCIGLVLALWPSGGGGTAKQTEAEEAGVLWEEAAPDALEEQLARLLSKMEGVGRVEVLLTLRQGSQQNYVYNSSTREDGGEAQFGREEQKELVVISQGGEESPVVSSVSGPEYQGAVVLCDGADDPRVCLEITQAIRSLTGITSDHIKISKMKQ